MILIRILSVGKTKERWLEEALSEYEKRLSAKVKIEWVTVKQNGQLLKLLGSERAVLLDVSGKAVSSVEFSNELEKQGSRITFVIGGADGLPKELLIQGHSRISLSRLTLTHQMVRLLLIEQIYRGYQILAGTPYHR